jgi:hypothetical protein
MALAGVGYRSTAASRLSRSHGLYRRDGFSLLVGTDPGWVIHASRPDVEAPSVPEGKLPGPPDPLALVVARIADGVRADVSLDPPAAAVLYLVLTVDRERSDRIKPGAADDTA